MFGTLFSSSDIVGTAFGTGMIATVATAMLTLLGLSWVSERWRIPLALSGVALLATGFSYLESGTVWLAGQKMSAAYRYTAWFTVQPLQVAALFFYARIAGPVPSGVFWRATVAAVLMVLSRYLGDAGIFLPTLAVLLSIAFWLYILGEAYFGAESSAVRHASREMRLGYFWIRLIFTIGWAIYPVLFFVETVIGAGHNPGVIVLYSIAARAIEIRRAAQLAEIENERSTSTISITTAQVRIEEESERIRIARDRAIEAERINTANHIRTLEIERQRDTEIAEINSRTALEGRRIATRQEIEADRIANEQKVREQDIRSRQTISIAEATAAAEADQIRIAQERSTEEARIATSRVLELLQVDRDKQIRVSNEEAQAEQERAAILKRYAVDVERLRKDEEIVQLEITKNQTIKLAETEAFRQIEDARIGADRRIDELRIAARRFIDRFEIERQQEIEIVDKERLIAVVNKTIEEAVARTEAAQAQRALVEAEERIDSTRAEEVANRTKLVELIDASTKVERETKRTVAIARADKEAVEQRALAEIAEANASEVRYAKDAEGHRLLNESENMRSDAARRSAIYENLVKSLPNIIRETVKPMERIESIKILQVDGLPGLNSPSEMAGAGGGGGGNGGDGNISDRVVNSAMKYRTQVAFVDGLMKDLGLPLENLGSAGGMSFRNFPPPSGGKSGKDDD